MEVMSRENKKTSLGSEWDTKSIVGEETDYLLEGNTKKKVKAISSLEQAGEDDLAFCSWEGEKAYSLVAKSKAGIILCSRHLMGFVHPAAGAQIVFLDNPRLVFVNFVNRVQKRRQNVRISPTSIVAKTASLGSNCHIGNFVVIGENCIVGDNSVIYDRAVLAQNCTIGKGCVIQSGVIIGSDGFAFERDASGKLVKFPHLGGVVIGDNVEICANSSIARGSLSDTIIGDGTKIDALVHIAHNVHVGKDCQLTAGTIIGGSTVIGDSCWTGLNATLKNKITLGRNVIVGAGACVIRDVPDGDVVAGVPAKSIKSKVSSSEVFLMAGQPLKEKEDKR